MKPANTNYRSGWQRTGSVLALPVDWQRPARTEEWAYERCLASLPQSPFLEVVCFPWATLIDLFRKGEHDRTHRYIRTLRAAPPRATLVRATICQHISAKDMLPWFHQLKITDLFWSHATTQELELEGIRVHPFPLYPVRCADQPIEMLTRGVPLAERSYLYSFIGAYEPGLYLSSSRQWIFELPRRPDAYVVRRRQWHYEQDVYGEQVHGAAFTAAQRREQQVFSSAYSAVIRETKFALCPSGSGPNSIRLWEALGHGAIPVILSDSHRLPGSTEQWKKAAIIVAEDACSIASLPAHLELRASHAHGLTEMQHAGAELWNRYGLTGFIHDIASLSAGTWLGAHCLPPRAPFPRS
jgi:hypothetical protein